MFGVLDQTPRSLLVLDRSSFQEQKNRLNFQVEALDFSYKVSVLLPGCSSAPPHLDTVLNSFSSFYLIRSLPVYELLDRDFLEAVYQGGVYGISYRTRIDEDNCVALMPNGHLTLSLDKDSFEVLGVEGKPSRFNHRTNSRFDLTDSCMAPGGRGYQRLLAGLRSLNLKMDFLLSHHTVDSLKALLTRYDWSEHRPEVNRRTLTDLSCPVMQSSDLQSCDPHSFLEWLGAVDAEISCKNSSDSFLSSLVDPEPKTTINRALWVSVCGLLLPLDLHRLIQQIRCYLEQTHLEHLHLPWASLTVHGFADSPVSWGGNEHGFLRGGENFYSLLMFQDQTYQLHLATGANDTCPP